MTCRIAFFGLVLRSPLIAAEAGPLSFEGSALMQPPSQGVLFVPSQTKSTSRSAEESSSAGAVEGGTKEKESGVDSNINNANFQAHRLRVKYLNMTHDTVETSVESFDIFASMTYQSTRDGSTTDDGQETGKILLTLGGSIDSMEESAIL